MNKNGQQSAFAIPSLVQSGNVIEQNYQAFQEEGSPGLSKREYFAAKVLQGLCATGMYTDIKMQNSAEEVKSNISQVMAVAAVDLADNLLVELERITEKVS